MKPAAITNAMENTCKTSEKRKAPFVPNNTGIEFSLCSLSKASSCKA
jgi:hypothetical protein